METAAWRPPWVRRRAGAAELLGVYRALREAYGPQRWWPAETPFEMAVGAVLTQGTNWRNVERAIENLRAAAALAPGPLLALGPAELAALIRPAGYFRVKARRLRALVTWLVSRHGGSLAPLGRGPLGRHRAELLGVPGVGPETADAILLYGAGRPVFVVDAYTRRILGRHGIAPPDAGYARLQGIFMEHLPPRRALFNEYHALLVRLGKECCRPRAPRCETCPIRRPPRAPAGGGRLRFSGRRPTVGEKEGPA